MESIVWGWGGLFWEVKPREAKVFLKIFDTEQMKFRWKKPKLEI